MDGIQYTYEKNKNPTIKASKTFDVMIDKEVYHLSPDYIKGGKRRTRKRHGKKRRTRKH